MQPTHYLLQQGNAYPDRTSAIVAVSKWSLASHVPLARTDDREDLVQWACCCRHEYDSLNLAGDSDSDDDITFPENHQDASITLSRQSTGQWIIARFNPGHQHFHYHPVPPQREHIMTAVWALAGIQSGSTLLASVRNQCGDAVTPGQVRYAAQQYRGETTSPSEVQWQQLPEFLRQLQANHVSVHWETEGTIPPYQLVRWVVVSPWAAQWCMSAAFTGVVFLDGCHLNDSAKGTLLVAATVDANRDVIPIAFSWCQGETTDNYKRLLQNCTFLPHNVVFLSDQCPGVSAAVQAIFPHAAHCPCVYHLAKGLGPARAAFLQLVASENKAIYDKRKAEFAAKHPTIAASVFPKLRLVTRFEGAPFKMGYEADSPIESVNSALMAIRSDEPIDLIVGLLGYCNRRLRHVKAVAQNGAGSQWVEKCRNIIAVRTAPTGPNDHIIEEGGISSVLTLLDRGVPARFIIQDNKCTCMTHEKTHIPCRHMWLVMQKQRRAPEWYEMIDSIYRIEHIVQAVRDVDEFVIPSTVALERAEDIAPPSYRTRAGRPKMRRMRRPDEGEAPPQRQMRCSKCKALGHNRRSCRF